jgi:taurine dioxygenase
MDIRNMTRSPTHLDVQPITPQFGAEIAGIDLGAELSSETVAEIRSMLLRYKVIVLRNQEITTGQHVAFARMLGQPDIHHLTPSDQPHPEVLHLRNGPQSPAERGKMADTWHQDGSWRADPLWVTILRSRVVPNAGGDTLFSDMGAAFQGLSPIMKDWVQKLTAIHDMALGFDGRSTMTREEIHALHPPQEHPVVVTHPETGERLLYINSTFGSRIKGLSPVESHWLVQHLSSQALIPDYQIRVRWKPNTIVLWDDWACQHYGVYDYHPAVREMERVAIASTFSLSRP